MLASTFVLQCANTIDAFFLEHRLCGYLEGGPTDGRMWMACAAQIERAVEILQ